MIVFVSNYLNHHQMPLAMELYELTGGQYRFVEMEKASIELTGRGFIEYNGAALLVQAWKSSEQMAQAERLVVESDVVIYGSLRSMGWIRRRLNAGRLTFEYGERWLKRGFLNLLSPRLLKSQLLYHTCFFNKPLYRLNASAYAAGDLRKMLSFRHRMFKWGYFTAIPEFEEKKLELFKDVSRLKILFVARFLIWKHPWMPVVMAQQLKDAGYIVDINMYGTGPELPRIERLIAELDVADMVHLFGNVSNSEILAEMRRHDIFVFTSDRNEGWGAVVNEAMSSGCAVVASNAVGSVPFLIKNGENGMVFNDRDVNDLTKQVKYLLDHPIECRRIGVAARATMVEEWSPRRAAENLLRLIDGIGKGHPNIVFSGPCSPDSSDVKLRFFH